MKTKRILFVIALIAACSFRRAASAAADISAPAFDAAAAPLHNSQNPMLPDDSRLKYPLTAVVKRFEVRALRSQSSLPELQRNAVQIRCAQAWTSIVGWRPGASAFPDPISHEAGLTLVTVRQKQQ